MTRDEVMRLAREAGFQTADHHMADGSVAYSSATYPGNGDCLVGLERFAELVAVAERRSCAELCEVKSKAWPYPSHGNAAATTCAAAIRDR